MNTRREVRQLIAGDQIRTDLKLHWEIVGQHEMNEAGTVTLHVRPASCGPDCGTNCDCHSAMFGESGPFTLTLKGSQRVAFFGNLKQLLEDSRRIQAQIARLQVGKSANDDECDLEVLEEPESDLTQN